MTITITRHCFLCGKASHISCEEVAWSAYENGALAQDVFSDMDLQTRETLISGMCPACQASFFEEEEDSDCDGECDICAEFDCPGNASRFAPWDE